MIHRSLYQYGINSSYRMHCYSSGLRSLVSLEEFAKSNIIDHALLHVIPLPVVYRTFESMQTFLEHKNSSLKVMRNLRALRGALKCMYVLIEVEVYSYFFTRHVRTTSTLEVVDLKNCTEQLYHLIVRNPILPNLCMF